jgi:5-methylcytosine-specific restriction endonuclease McrA
MKKGSINPHLWRARVGKCLICGKEYRAIKDFKKRKQKYCSRECWSKRNPPIKKTCDCGKEFTTYQRTKKYCSFECRNKVMIGRKIPEAVRLKMSLVKKGIRPKNNLEWKGEKHPAWKKDRSMIELGDMEEYKKLRLLVFRRDKFICLICNKNSRNLELHHIKPRRTNPELALDENNCQTLCHDCHKKTDSYLNRW